VRPPPGLFTSAQERFRADARAWLADRLNGRFATVRGRGGPGDEHECFEERWEWERELGRDQWIGLGWPAEHGGRGATLVEQMIFFEE
jgi:alkylation response protein AidB-like acyl-CoA dehydrogenase